MSSAEADYALVLGSNSAAIGLASVALAGGNTNLGADYSTALSYGYASGDYSVAIGVRDFGSSTSPGDYSIALGGANAVGINAIAFGSDGTGTNSSTASGNYSTAMGGGNATSINSTAIGTQGSYRSIASGIYSTAIGGGIASSQSSTAIGLSSAEADYALVLGANSAAVGLASVALAGGNTNLGADYSTAFSYGYASGDYSVAIGVNGYGSSTSPGDYSIALGGANAVGTNSIAFGSDGTATNSSTASGNYSTAMGGGNATGSNTVAIGSKVSTNGNEGAFAFGDHSSVSTPTNNDATNQMMMRFAGGSKLYSDASATVGTQLAPGGSSWSTISDVRKKENFTPVNGEDFLNKITGFKLTSWNYKGQDPKLFRHYGPMAQDFYAAFGKDNYGTVGNDTTISQADMEGVSFVAIQALVKRAEELQTEVATLKAENKTVTTQNNALKAELAEQNKTLITRMKMIEAELEKVK